MKGWYDKVVFNDRENAFMAQVQDLFQDKKTESEVRKTEEQKVMVEKPIEEKQDPLQM